jgi:hypothetical protein
MTYGSGFSNLHNLENLIMSKRLPAMIMTLIPLGLAPMTALAQGCGDYQLSQAQLDYLDSQSLLVEAPQGTVPVIQRCDIDGNNTVDINDIRAIAMARNQPAAHPDDPMDWDRNSVINILDARGCQQACTLPRCAVQATEPEQLVGGTTEVADCFQTQDFDGDGSQDFAGLSEQTEGPARGGDWTLEVVILNEDAAGNMQHVIYPYTGRKSDTDEIQQHLSPQPAGVVNLNPGTVTIDQPGFVSYQDGEPKVLYYFVDGEIVRALYGIDD